MKKRRQMISYLMVFALVFAMMPVNASAKAIKLTNSSGTKTMPVGSTFLIQTNQKASTLTFSSSKGKVASVTKSGLIQAKKKGTTVITIVSGKSSKKIKVTVKKPTGYTITKKAGNYPGSVKTKVKAKKGYTVYYTVSGKFKKSWKINAKKTKTFVFTKTTTLKLYPVKKTVKMTTAKLNKTQSKNKNRGDYLYTISASASTASPNTSATPAAVATSTPETSQVPSATETPIPTTGNSQFPGDDSETGYVAPEPASYDEMDKNTEPSEDAVEITLPTKASGTKTTTDTYEISKKNKLTIIAPGTYMIHTESTETASDGLIEADLPDGGGTVHLILDGVNLTSSNNTAPDSDTGLITVKKSVTRAVITIKENTVTTLTDTGETGIDKDDGVSVTYTAGIVCKKTPLTINGSGVLNITSLNGNGIKATESLKILDTKISVSGTDDNAAGHNGISGKTGLFVKNAAIDIYSDGDGLKTTLDKSDIADDLSLAELGNMDIDGGTYKIVSNNGDAISVFRTLNLAPTEMEVVTKNLSASREDGSYKGIKAGTTISIPSGTGNIIADTTDTYDASRSGRDANDSYADDTIHCDGYIKIEGGNLELSSGDDGIHADKGLVINGGTIDIKESYEGMEGADVTVNGGTITIKSRDDGINAGGGNDADALPGNGMDGDHFDKGDTPVSANYQIIINDGIITIDADGDGIDSNGNIFFRGGIVTVNGPTDGGNGALDYGDKNSVCEISGGTLIAAGSVGMASAPTSGSSQPAVNVVFSEQQPAGTYVVLKDASGNTVMTAQPTKKFQSVVMSCGELTLGSTYTVYYGTSPESLAEETSFSFFSISVSAGTEDPGHGGWNPGILGGNQPGGRR